MALRGSQEYHVVSTAHRQRFAQAPVWTVSCGEESETIRPSMCMTQSCLVALPAATSPRQLFFFYLLESPTTMSDDEGKEPIQLGKRTLDAIIEGVVTKLRESPPVKRPNDGSSSSSAGKGE